MQTARFTRMKLHEVYSDDHLFIADAKTEILTLLQGNHIVVQRRLNLQYTSLYNSVHFIKLFWHAYPGYVAYDILIDFMSREREGASKKLNNNPNRALHSYIFTMRKQLQMFGLDIVGIRTGERSKPSLGYALRKFDFTPVRSTSLEDVSLPDILAPNMTLTLNHQAQGRPPYDSRLLALVQGTALVEQTVLFPTAYRLLQLFLKNEHHSISQIDLVMQVYGANERQARKWLDDVKGDKQARVELMNSCWKHIGNLRDSLLPLGIQIVVIAEYGYELGRFVTTARERARRA